MKKSGVQYPIPNLRGNVYDEHSSYKGNVDSEGRFYDSHSNYKGRKMRNDPGHRFWTETP